MNPHLTVQSCGYYDPFILHARDDYDIPTSTSTEKLKYFNIVIDAHGSPGILADVMDDTELCDVVIFEIETRKVDAVIGKDMKRFDGSGTGRNTAELRQQTGLERVNDRYDVAIVEAGKYQKGDVLL